MSNCRSCNAEVLWAESPTTGRKIPLEVPACHPAERGALFLVDGRWAYSKRALVEGLVIKEGIEPERAELRINARYPAHLSHFATCPNADQHRRIA